MSVFSGLTGKEKLGGVFGLSCYLLLSDRIKNIIPEGFPNKETPFFLAHGEDDGVVKFEFGEMSSKMVKDLGVQDVSFHSYAYVSLFDGGLRHANWLIVALDIRRIRMRLTISRSSWRRFSPLRSPLVYEMMNPLLPGMRIGGSRWFSDLQCSSLR